MDIAPTILQMIAENVFFFGIMFVVTIAIVIFIHEMGHYLAARYCGVFVQKFAIGLGKEIFGFGDGKETTRWSFHILPIGGFVKLFGEVDPDKLEVWDEENSCVRKLREDELSKSYCLKPVWQRMLIVVAGPLINILFTLFIFAGVFSFYGQASKPVVINAVAIDAPAYQAGIEMGDIVIEMDGRPIRRLEDIYDLTWSELPPKEHSYTVLRDGNRQVIRFSAREVSYTGRNGIDVRHGQTGMVRLPFINFDQVQVIDGVNIAGNAQLAREMIEARFDKRFIVGLSLRNDEYQDSADVPPSDVFQVLVPSRYNKHLLSNASEDVEFHVGVFLVNRDANYYVRLSGVEALQRSAGLMKDSLVQSYKAVRAVIVGRSDERIFSGFVRLGEKTGNAAKAGLYSYLLFLGIVSYMIAVINLLPIPVLDGGYLALLGFEAITGKAVSQRMQDRLMIIGLVILMGIMIFANISDFVSYIDPN